MVLNFVALLSNMVYEQAFPPVNEKILDIIHD